MLSALLFLIISGMLLVTYATKKDSIDKITDTIMEELRK